jgi:hypothetical protein
MLILFGVLVFVYHIGIGIYNALGVEPLPAFEFLYTAGFLCGVVWWLRAEAKNSPVARTYCEGVLVGIGWIFIIPYHLLKTRGVKGLIPLLALIITFVAAKVLSVVVLLLSSDGISSIQGGSSLF